MRPIRVTQTGVGISSWIVLDRLQAPFNIGFSVTVSGVATYTIEHTYDDVFNTAITPTVFSHSTMVGQTVTKEAFYDHPVFAVRINQTAGAGSSILSLLQGMVH